MLRIECQRSRGSFLIETTGSELFRRIVESRLTSGITGLA